MVRRFSSHFIKFYDAYAYKNEKRTFSKEFSIKGCLFQNWTFINVHFRKNLPFYNFKKKTHIL